MSTRYAKAKRALVGGDGLAAVYIISNGVGTMYYVSKDYLGNIMLLTRDNGTVAEEYSYDAWGRRRSPTDWTNYNVSAPSLLYRGYTGHEHLDEFTLINMNGRVYDPLVGRFLSPDNYVQAPGNTQSYNRYSYCLNNPLKYIDPNGYAWWKTILGTIAVNVIGIPLYIITGGTVGFVGYYDDDDGRLEILIGTIWNGGTAQVDLSFDDRKFSIFGGTVINFDASKPFEQNEPPVYNPGSPGASGSEEYDKAAEGYAWEISVTAAEYNAQAYWDESLSACLYGLDPISSNYPQLIIDAMRNAMLNGNGIVNINALFPGGKITGKTMTFGNVWLPDTYVKLGNSTIIVRTTLNPDPKIPLVDIFNLDDWSYSHSIATINVNGIDWSYVKFFIVPNGYFIKVKFNVMEQENNVTTNLELLSKYIYGF